MCKINKLAAAVITRVCLHINENKLKTRKHDERRNPKILCACTVNTGWTKSLNYIRKFMAPLYDDTERRSMCHRVRTGILSVAIFKCGLHNFRESQQNWK